jgi:hypothetical protein
MSVKALKITGNPRIDGIITAILGLVMEGISIGMAYFFGAPSVWWTKFGGIWASILFGIHLALILGGIVYFFVGLLVFRIGKAGIEEFWNDIKNLIIFFGVLVALEILVLYNLLDVETFLTVVKWMIVVVLGIPLVTYVFYVCKKVLLE